MTFKTEDPGLLEKQKEYMKDLELQAYGINKEEWRAGFDVSVKRRESLTHIERGKSIHLRHDEITREALEKEEIWRQKSFKRHKNYELYLNFTKSESMT